MVSITLKLINPKKNQEKPNKTQKNPAQWVFFKKTRVFAHPEFDSVDSPPPRIIEELVAFVSKKVTHWRSIFKHSHTQFSQIIST